MANACGIHGWPTPIFCRLSPITDAAYHKIRAARAPHASKLPGPTAHFCRSRRSTWTIRSRAPETVSDLFLGEIGLLGRHPHAGCRGGVHESRHFLLRTCKIPCCPSATTTPCCPPPTTTPSPVMSSRVRTDHTQTRKYTQASCSIRRIRGAGALLCSGAMRDARQGDAGERRGE